MIRRVFLRRLLHGLGFAAAVQTVADDKPRPEVAPGRRKSADVTLYRCGEIGRNEPYARIDWSEQKPGDTVVAIWADGTAEAWLVTSPPHWTDGEHGPVEGVGCEQVLDRKPLLPLMTPAA